MIAAALSSGTTPAAAWSSSESQATDRLTATPTRPLSTPRHFLSRRGSSRRSPRSPQPPHRRLQARPMDRRAARAQARRALGPLPRHLRRRWRFRASPCPRRAATCDRRSPAFSAACSSTETPTERPVRGSQRSRSLVTPTSLQDQTRTTEPSRSTIPKARPQISSGPTRTPCTGSMPSATSTPATALAAVSTPSAAPGEAR